MGGSSDRDHAGAPRIGSWIRLRGESEVMLDLAADRAMVEDKTLDSLARKYGDTLRSLVVRRGLPPAGLGSARLSVEFDCREAAPSSERRSARATD
jgi:RNA 3'-terminal phosphate cyclase